MIFSKNEFCSIIGYDISEVDMILDNLDMFYYEYYSTKKDKLGNKIYANGQLKKRKFKPSKLQLKDVQNRMQRRVLSRIPLIDNIKGSVKGVSSIDNAKCHRGKEYFFQTDLTKCFPSITSKMVFNSLRAKGFSKQVANLITQLTTVKSEPNDINMCLPQGAPTSPTLANIVIEKVDKKILSLILKRGITYTRWVDDLTFSSDKCFIELIPEIMSLIGRNGLKPSRKKTTYKHKRTLITGAVVYKNLKVSQTFRILQSRETNPNKIAGRNNYKKQINKANKKVSTQ